MSGGFFRGTSADQDTRFSNKQAKLLKSQKFAPELEHLVDMRKVKMDVIRPWIANRVTELLGFEDEVLINFINGLLEPKEVNGKEVQIQLTGFMEKNTVKFMKELWALLLSAQKNESGVPQQFLDAKEAETRKKQAEVDRITSEIQKKKEKESQELELERSKEMDGGAERKTNVGAAEADMESSLKGSKGDNEDDKEANNRNGVRRRNRYSTSPWSTHRSSSSPQSKSTSRSPEVKRKSISSERAYPSPRRSISPRRRYSSRGSRSPTRRTSSYTRQRSISSSRRRSPSPTRRRLRSPFRRRSPSPLRRRRSPSPIRRRRWRSPIRRRRLRSPIRRRRSPSPIRRRRSPSPFLRRRSPLPLQGRSPSPMSPRSPSPVRRRSPSPVRRRSISPVYDRSPSPLRRRSCSRSPVWRRSPLSMRRRSGSPSPIHRRSPLSIGRRSRSPSPHRRSPSPLHRRYDRSPSTPDRGSPSPSTPRRGSPSPRRRYPIPARTRSPVHSPTRSHSPYGSSSPSLDRCRSPSPMRRPLKGYRSPMQSPQERLSKQEKMHRPSASSRSPERDAKDRKSLQGKLSSLSSPRERSWIQLQSAVSTRARLANEERRSPSPHESPLKRRGRKNRFSGSSESPVRERRDQSRHEDSLSPQQKLQEQKPKHATPESSKEYEDPDHARRGYKSRSARKWEDSPVKVPTKDNNSSEKGAVHKTNESRSLVDNKDSKKKDHEMTSDKGSRKGVYSRTPDGCKSPTSFGERPHAFYTGEGQKYEDRDRLHLKNFKDDRSHRSEIKQTSGENLDCNNGGGAFDSGSGENGKHRTENKEKRKHKRSHREEMASDDYSSDSEIEYKKEAKRRRKEEKKLRKEEKRRRHEERRRRREERRAAKMKTKDIKHSHSSDDEHAEDTQLEQKELEIELRKKALESLKAKKGINH